jgi:hypothetical protein
MGNPKPERSTANTRQQTRSGPKESSTDVSQRNRNGGHRQIPPAEPGKIPDAETLLLGALLDCRPATVTEIQRFVQDDDLADPFRRRLLAAIRQAADDNEAGVPAVSRRLMQSGSYGTQHGKPLQRNLIDAATCGACGLASWQYAADVVELAQLRLLTGCGDVGSAAATLPTHDRLRYVTAYVDGLAGVTARLTELRRRSGGTAA